MKAYARVEMQQHEFPTPKLYGIECSPKRLAPLRSPVGMLGEEKQFLLRRDSNHDSLVFRP
jgi:hypothetical protein